MIMDKKVIKELARHLSNYTNYKKSILDIEEGIIYNNTVDVNSGIKSKNKISKTVENLAIKLSSNIDIKFYKSWISIIDELQCELLEEPIKLKILRYKYIDKATKVTDHKVISKIEEEGYPMTINLYYQLKEQIFYKFEKMAKIKGLIE